MFLNLSKFKIAFHEYNFLNAAKHFIFFLALIQLNGFAGALL